MSAGQEAPQTRDEWIEYFAACPADERVSRAIDCLCVTQGHARGQLQRAESRAAELQTQLASTDSALAQCRALLKLECESVEPLRNRAEAAEARAAAAEGALVPREPTQAMVDSGRARVPRTLEPDEAKWLWRAMYDAAPKEPR